MDNIQLDQFNEEQMQAFNLVKNTNFSFFLTGRAGTGKTTFLHYIQKNVDKQFVVVAPTGVAAILAGGVTIHSFFGMPFDPITPMTEFQINPDKQILLRKVNTIIIDEVSMVRCDLIDGIDRILRKAMHTSQPFGGKQIIFSGDLYQLEPVVDKRDEGLMQFFREKYNTEHAYFYEANVFSRLKLPRIEFKKVYRQSDAAFLSILDNIRSGQYNPSELMLLNNNGLRNMQESNEETLTLCSRNDTADTINTSKLAAIDSQERMYTGKVEGDFSNKRFPVQQELSLKVGARVMFCRNDKNHRWVNGTVGTVEDLSEDKISIKLDNGNICDVDMVSWENVTYTYDKTKKALTKQVIGTYTQYPLKLAWAITIHKSQGMTFEKMNIDFSKGTFMPGQLYVALSRVTSIEGLGLSSRILPYYISQRPEIDHFLHQYNSMEDIRMDVSEYATYNQALLNADYDCAATECLRLMHDALDKKNLDDAYFAAVKLMDTLYDTSILRNKTHRALLPGNDERTLLINAIIAIENEDYSNALSFADQGMFWDSASNFYYVKSIALLRMGNIKDAVAFNEEWQKYVRSEDNSIDTRCLYHIAQTNFVDGGMFIGDMQTVIQHDLYYIPAYETLQKMFHQKGIKLETDNEQRILVDIFNGTDGNLSAAWRNSDTDAKRVLIKAIIDYPYSD